MEVVERTLESLATRGTPRGAEALIERLEAELQAAPIRPIAPYSGVRRPIGWKRGSVVAAATAAVIVAAIVLGALLVRSLDDDKTPPATVTTTLGSDLEPPGPEDLFEGMAVLQGNDIGIYEGGSFTSLASEEWGVTTVLGDLAGGAVYQNDDMSVLLFAGDADGGNSTVLLEAGPGERLSLEDTALIDGERVAVALRFETDAGGERVTLITVGLATGEVADVVELGDGAVLVDRVTYGGGRYLITHVDGDETRFEFRDANGSVVEDAANPRPMPSSSMVSQGVISRDGTTMVYIDRATGDAGGGLADVVTFDLVAGVELSRLEVASPGDRIIEFEGDRLLIARRRTVPGEPPVIVGLHLTEGARMTSDGSFSIELLSPR